MAKEYLIFKKYIYIIINIKKPKKNLHLIHRMSNQCNFLVKDIRSPYQQNLHHTSDNIYPKYYLKYPSYFINYIQLLFVTLNIYKKKNIIPSNSE